MFGKPGFFTNVFQNIFEIARRPREELISRLILRNIFLIRRQPIFRQQEFTFFISVGRAGITDKNLWTVRRIEINVIEANAETFALFDSSDEQKMNQSE